MTHYDDFIKIVKKEIRNQGYYRKKFSFLLWQMWGYRQKNKEFLNGLDQALFENDILVYTKAENVREERENWDWFNLKSNEAYITFVANKKSIIKNLPYRTLLKMNVVNEPTPTEKLFTQFATKAREILICSAYLDEAMSTLLADIAKKNEIKIRFVADVNFNSNPYKRGIIRSKIETVGTFRTLAGVNNEDGIMHLKLYVFYLSNNEVAIFNTSANFTAAAWRFTNSESPVTIQTGKTDNTQISIMVNAAENIWKKSENDNHMNKLKQGDKVSHSGFGIGEIFKITGDAAQVVFAGGNFQTVKVADLQIIIDPLQMIEEGSKGERDTIHRTKAKFLAHYIYSQNSLTNESMILELNQFPINYLR